MPYNAGYNTTMSGVSALGTMSGVSALGSFGSVIPLVVTIVVIASIIGILMTSKRFYNFLMWLKNTFGYFFYGVGTSIIFGGTYYFVRWNTQQVQSGNPWLLKWFAYIILGYIGLSGLGYLMKTFVLSAIKSKWVAAKKLAKKRATT